MQHLPLHEHPHLRSQQAQLHIQDGTCSRLSTSSVTINQRNQSIRHTLSSNRMGMVQHPAVPIIISSSSWWYKAMMFHGTATAGRSKEAMMAAASVRQVDAQQVSEGLMRDDDDDDATIQQFPPRHDHGNQHNNKSVMGQPTQQHSLCSTAVSIAALLPSYMASSSALQPPSINHSQWASTLQALHGSSSHLLNI